jgi:hypothetical protein
VIQILSIANQKQSKHESLRCLESSVCSFVLPRQFVHIYRFWLSLWLWFSMQCFINYLARLYG